MTWHSDALDSTTAAALLAVAAGLILLLGFWQFALPHLKGRKVTIKHIRDNYVVIALLLGAAIFTAAVVFYLAELAWIVNEGVNTLEAVAQSRAQTEGEEARSTAFQNYATGIAALLAALAAAATLAFQLIRVWINERNAKNAEQGLITDRINKAVEGLGAEKTVKKQRTDKQGNPTYRKDEQGNNDYSQPVMVEVTEPNLEVRIGAVLALERIAKDSLDDHIQIMEILCAYIRENACIVNIGSDELPMWRQRVDTQTAINVIGRRGPTAIQRETAAKQPYRLDLRNAHLSYAEMTDGNFDAALFHGSKARALNAGKTSFRGAEFQNCEMSFRWMMGADFTGTWIVDSVYDAASDALVGLEGGAFSHAKSIRGLVLVGTTIMGASLLANSGTEGHTDTIGSADTEATGQLSDSIRDAIDLIELRELLRKASGPEAREKLLSARGMTEEGFRQKYQNCHLKWWSTQGSGDMKTSALIFKAHRKLGLFGFPFRV